MFKTNLKTAWRSLLKDRQFTILNLVGLSTGLACALLIYLWVNDELKVDRYNEKDSRLYQVMSNMKSNDGIKTGTNTPGIMAPALASEFPEVEHAVTVLPASWFPNNGVITAGDVHLKAAGDYIGKDYFNVFTCKFIDGDKTPLQTDKSAIAISDELALKLFNTTSGLVGKTVKWDHGEFSGNYFITGVFKKNPPNATEQFDILFNYDLCLEKRTSLLSWTNSDPSTYIVIKEGADVKQLNNKIKDFTTAKDKNSGLQLFLIKYSDKYLHGQFENGVESGGRIAYVKLFSIIALFILIIACINFMNLSTAKASRRIKEVGIKKVVGAGRSGLIFQYMGESIMMAFLSLLFAAVLIVIFLPQFNNITGKHIGLLFDSKFVFFVLGITLLTGIMAGSYPAFYLSSFKPAVVLKGKLKTSISELLIRKGLVVFQFTLSVIFIILVVVVYRQIDYIQSKNLGYNRDNIIHFEIPMEMNEASLKSAASFLDEVKKVPGVVNASSYYHNLTGEHGSIGGFQWPGKDEGKDIDFANLEVGYNFIETAGIELKEGRSFSSNENSHNEIIFNEAAIASMGLKDPIGKTVKFWDQQRQIVGVVKNFHFESLYETVKPCFFQVYPVMPNIMVKIKAGTEKQTIAQIQKAFAAYNKGLLFDYQFLDENYKALYVSEQRVAVLSKYFAGLAILISCLGLFGLAAFTAQRRQKEIGIRKVVGATVSNVVVMLSKDFLKLVLIAVLFAFPLAWWATHQWLHGFAYRIPIGADIFLIAGAATIFITLATISFQAIKAALANPVKSLRTE